MMGDLCTEILLGFDAREMWAPSPAPLDTYALRVDIEKVLSADVMIWPSVLESAGAEWIGPNVPFWEDLELFNAALARAEEPRPYWRVAATWHTDMSFRREARQHRRFAGPSLGPHVLPVKPPVRDPGWRFLGYDITDDGFLSGLSNCGYEKTERPALVERWSPYLNRHHLFDDPGRAFEFRAFSNQRVTEHAPFFVIGLWQIMEPDPARGV